MHTTRFSWKENTIALGVAFVLVILGMIILNNTGMFRADILQPTSTPNINEQGDLLYKVQNSELSLSSNKNISGAKSLSIYVIYNPQKLSLLMQNIKTSYEYTTSQAGDGKLYLVFVNINNIKASDTLFTLGLSGMVESLAVSDPQVTFESGEVESLSISRK